MIYAKYKNKFSGATDEKVLRGDNIIKTKVSTTTAEVVNAVSLSRGQLYSQVDRMCDIVFSFAIFGVTILLCLGKMQRARCDSKRQDHEAEAQRFRELNKAEHKPKLSQHKIHTEADDLTAGYDKIAKTVQPLVYMLEGTLRASILQMHPKWSTLEVEDELTCQMRELATDFMNDVKFGYDSTTHIKLLLDPSFFLRKMWLWIRSGLHRTWFNTAVTCAIVLEVIVDQKAWDESTLYIIQGTLVLALGFDAFINAILEYQTSTPIRPGSTHKIHKETVVGVFVVPSLWLVLSFSSASSEYYYCHSLPCQAKHYLYPLLFLMRNHTLWISIMAFGQSMVSAATVLLLFFCFLLTTTGVATLMLQGVYSEGDTLYENNQYFSFSQSFVTMLVYLVNGDNYIEAASIGLRESIWYSVFFVACTVIGMFFITALLIESFCGSYEEDQQAVHQVRRRNERRSQVVVMTVWSRHSYHSIGTHGPHRNIEPSAQYMHYWQQGLTRDAFVDLISSVAFGARMGSWGANMKLSVEGLVDKLIDGPPIQEGSLAHESSTILLDLCAEMTLHSAYGKLCHLLHTETPMTERRINMIMLLQETIPGHTKCTYKQTCWIRGRSPEDNELEEALAALPRLRGLVCAPKVPSPMDWLSKNFVDSKLQGEMCRLLQLSYLHKWSIDRTFSYLDDSSDGILQWHEFDQVCRLCDTLDYLAHSKLLRLEAFRVSVERQKAGLLEQGADANVGEIEKDHRCLHYSGLIGSDTLFEQQVHEDHTVFRLHAQKHSKPKHITIDALHCALVDQLFIWNLVDESLQESVQEIVGTCVAYGDKTVEFKRFMKLREKLRDSLIKKASSNCKPHQRPLLLLLREHSRVLEAIKMVRESGLFGEAELTFIFQIIAWIHVSILSQYHSGQNMVSVDTLDYISMAIALLPWASVVILIRSRGLTGYISFEGGAAEVQSMLFMITSFTCLSR